MSTSKKEITTEQKQECAALKSIYEAKKAELGLTQMTLSDELDMSQGAISHYLNGVNPLNAPVASAFARILKTPVGEFSPRLAQEIKDMAETIEIESLKRIPEKEIEEDGMVTLKLFDVAASCGVGVINPEYPELLKSIKMPVSSINELFNRKSMSGIEIISPDGDSMEPTIPKKSVAFVDTSCTEFVGDGVYIFVYGGACYMKRLQRIPINKFIAISDNKNYKEFEIPLNEGCDFRIVAKLVKALSLEMIEL